MRRAVLKLPRLAVTRLAVTRLAVTRPAVPCLLLAHAAIAAPPGTPASTSNPGTSNPGTPNAGTINFRVVDETDPQEISEDTVLFIDGKQVAHYQLDRTHLTSVAQITLPKADHYDYALCGRITVLLPDGSTQQKIIDGGATLHHPEGILYRALAADDFTIFYLADSRADPPNPPYDAHHTDACSLPVS